jgi:hypothetical protein
MGGSYDGMCPEFLSVDNNLSDLGGDFLASFVSGKCGRLGRHLAHCGFLKIEHDHNGLRLATGEFHGPFDANGEFEELIGPTCSPFHAEAGIFIDSFLPSARR